jgi:hypothetical protein
MNQLDLRATTISHLHEILDVLTLGLTLESDSEVQHRLLPGCSGRFAIAFQGRNVWLEIGARRPSIVNRIQPNSLTIVTIPTANERDPGLVDLLHAGASRTRARTKAASLLEPVVSVTEIPSSHAIEAIMRWAPLVEMSCFQAAAGLTTQLDINRSLLFGEGDAVRAASKVNRREYAAQANLVARLTLLSTPFEARSWLLDIGRSFEWLTWTPSWSLLRERGLWLSGVAGRAAAAFGPDIVDRYLAILTSARHPIQTFDALFGITAIGLSSPTDRSAILRSLERVVASLRTDDAGASVTAIATTQALTQLRQPETAMQQSREFLDRLGGRRQLSASTLLRLDGTEALASGGYLAFHLLPAALSTPVTCFFPPTSITSRAGRRFGMSDGDIERLLTSAWGGAAGTASYTKH